ncbi:MAG TPA: DUF192 domain-containing protein [Caulobacteraceae bacterium]|nr:DUF192 domain-containing protein [Caulobacteraceae bacterium]
MTGFSRRAASALIAAAWALASCAAAEQGGAKAPGLERLEVVTDQGVRAFEVEIADDEEERRQGLMHRTDLPADRGMLFQFPDVRERSFWMQNTPLPLDIIYIGADGRIVSIARNTVPYSEAPVPSYGGAKGVLEINGGLSDRLGIEEGDQVRHPFFGTR